VILLSECESITELRGSLFSVDREPLLYCIERVTVECSLRLLCQTSQWDSSAPRRLEPYAGSPDLERTEQRFAVRTNSSRPKARKEVAGFAQPRLARDNPMSGRGCAV
jgi:hypothetical protein